VALAESYPLSIVIPVYNACAALQKCLDALLANELHGTEIVVVNDGSTDDTPAVANAMAEKWPDRIRVITNPIRQGPARSRNLGLREARFPYLFFLDADVIVPPETITKIRDSLDLYSHRSEVVGVLGMYSEKVPSPDFWSNYKNLYTCFLYEVTDPLSPFLHTPMFCCRKDVLETFGGFDERLTKGEDFKLGVQLGSRGYRFAIDRRIRGVHLKRYSLGEILKEDWSRVQHLRRIRLDPVERKFSYRAHRLSRLLSVILPLPIVFLLVLGGLLAQKPLLFSGLFLLLLFFLSHGRFLRYCKKKRGPLFTLQSAGFLFLEMLWAQLALIWSFLPFSGGKSTAIRDSSQRRASG